MKINLNEDFEDFWKNAFIFLGLASSVTMVVFLFIAMFSDHRPRSYYLCQEEGYLKIYGNCNWQFDTPIRLDRTISYDQALTILDRLNKTIK